MQNVQNVTNVEVITTITYLFFVYLILALLVERVVEVLVAFFNYLEFKFKWYEFWNRKAEAYRARYDRLYGYHGPGGERMKKLLSWLLWKSIAERPYEGGKEAVSANLIRLNYLRLSTRITAFLLSAGLVLWQHEQLDIAIIVDAVKVSLPEALRSVFVSVTKVITESPFFKGVLTAAAITIGSEPLHELISRIEKVLKSKSQSASAKAEGGAA